MMFMLECLLYVLSTPLKWVVFFFFANFVKDWRITTGVFFSKFLVWIPVKHDEFTLKR